MELKRLPIGIDDFAVAVKECYYVDKTGLIEDVCYFPTGTVCLYTRPRRFGKSLALSMLDCFFSDSQASEGLFKDKRIWLNNSLVKDNLNQYPLIHLDLKNTNASDYKQLLFKVQDSMAFLYESFPEIKNVSDYSREYWQRIHLRTLAEEEISASLRNLIVWLSQVRNKNCMVLIDEYDVPIQNAFDNGFYDKAVLFFKDFFGMALKGNSSLFKAVLTGVTQIGQASIFSGMNNLIVNSILSENKEEFFGFTEKEVTDMFTYYSLNVSSAEVKDWYGGYLFQNKEVYNPWSILNFIQNRGVFKEYWSNTSSYSPLKIVLENGSDPRGLELVSSLLNQEQIISPLKESLNLLDLSSDGALLSLLVYSGYLVPEASNLPLTYSFRFPNKEVSTAFRDELFDRYVTSRGVGLASALKNAISSGDEKGIEESMSSFLLRGFSYFDFRDEKNYQILVLTLSSILFDDSYVRSEVNAGNRRADIMIVPKIKGRCGIVFELKTVMEKTSKTRMQQSAANALKQIEDQDYVEILRQAGANPIIGYGLCFNAKIVKVVSKRFN